MFDRRRFSHRNGPMVTLLTAVPDLNISLSAELDGQHDRDYEEIFLFEYEVPAQVVPERGNNLPTHALPEVTQLPGPVIFTRFVSSPRTPTPYPYSGLGEDDAYETALEVLVEEASHQPYQPTGIYHDLRRMHGRVLDEATDLESFEVYSGRNIHLFRRGG